MERSTHTQQTANRAMLNRQYESFIDFVGELIDVDANAMLNCFTQHSRHKDALSYLYETFLDQYNPQLRELRGVYYTPEPLVSYIVRSVDLLLRTHFNCPNGLAEEERDITIFDPACGTGIFLQAVIKHTRTTFQKMCEHQRWLEYVHSYLLPHLFGFEILTEPYIIAHLKLAAQLAALDLPEAERDAWAYHLGHDEQLNIFLTNTLEQAPEMDILRLSRTNPIMVILGNPPYAGHSANKGQWIKMLVDAYKEDCPELKKPGQAKWLSDDYVKFMRFAQWQIEQAGKGILAFVTNHSYLDNPTFRGMRSSLLQSFDDVYILDLHGNSKKQEQTPDNSIDENVFDIQQGVVISVFVKDRDSGSFATVHHADLWGLREVYELDIQGQVVLQGGKFSWLAEHDLTSTHWQVINPQPPFYLFTPQDNQYLAEYQTGWSVADIFRPNGDPAPGVVTCHDQFAISWTIRETSDKVERFLATETENEARQLFRLCSQNQWQYAVAKSELQRGTWHQDVTEILYRPFDRRWTIFNRYVAVHRRERVMRHMLAGENIGLTIGRAGQVIDKDEWDIVFCTRLITEFNLYRRGGNNLFPLYLYIETSPGTRQANLASDFIMALTGRLQSTWVSAGHGDLQQTLGPDDIFNYMYAIFFSPTYRRRYAPFLKIDFPRLPLTSNKALFRALCSIGDRLVGLHLMDQCIALISYFPIPGDNRIERVRYIAQRQPEDKEPAYSYVPNETELRQIGNEVCASTATQSSNIQRVRMPIFAPQKSGDVKGRVWINATQYFDNVPLESWNFSIGGYQVCKKWLKDRKGRKLCDEDLIHYQQVIAILAETSHLMYEIDQLIEKHGGWPL